MATTKRRKRAAKTRCAVCANDVWHGVRPSRAGAVNRATTDLAEDLRARGIRPARIVKVCSASCGDRYLAGERAVKRPARKTARRKVKANGRGLLPGITGPFTARDWRHIRSTAAQMEDGDEETIMTSQGYVDVGMDGEDAYIRAFGQRVFDSDWPRVTKRNGRSVRFQMRFPGESWVTDRTYGSRAEADRDMPRHRRNAEANGYEVRLASPRARRPAARKRAPARRRSRR